MLNVFSSCYLNILNIWIYFSVCTFNLLGPRLLVSTDDINMLLNVNWRNYNVKNAEQLFVNYLDNKTKIPSNDALAIANL